MQNHKSKIKREVNSFNTQTLKFIKNAIDLKNMLPKIGGILFYFNVYKCILSVYNIVINVLLGE